MLGIPNKLLGNFVRKWVGRNVRKYDMYDLHTCTIVQLYTCDLGTCTLCCPQLSNPSYNVPGWLGVGNQPPTKDFDNDAIKSMRVRGVGPVAIYTQ